MLHWYAEVLILTWCFVQIHGQTGCKSTSSENLQTIASNCEVDFGSCSMEICFNCLLPDIKCCSPVRVMTNVTCPDDGAVVKYSKVIECKCLPCSERRVYIAGRIPNCGSDCEIFKIEVGGNEVTKCNTGGDFAFIVNNPQNNRVVFSVVDDTKKYLPSERAVELVENIQAYYGNIIDVTEGDYLPTFDSSAGHTHTLNRIQVQFQANSFVNPDGTPYSGEVTGRLSFINIFDVNRHPVPLLAVKNDESGVPRLLSSSGMLQIELITAVGQPLGANGVRMVLDTSDLTPFEIAAMGIWLANPEKGGWELVTSMTPSTGPLNRKKRQTSNATTVEGSVNIESPIQIWNLDALVYPYCYLKARIFMNEAAEGNQLSNVQILSAFQRTNYFTANFLLINSNANGACVPIQCNNRILNVMDFGVSLDFDTLPLNLPMEAASLFTASQKSFELIGFSIWTLTNDTSVLPNGPIYSGYSGCSNAPFSDYYFGFIIDAPANALVETNTVAIDEESIDSTWISDVFSWWPNQNTFTACYMKIELDIASGMSVIKRDLAELTEYKFEIRSLGGTHNVTKGGLYGTRIVTSYSSTACVEYKCPGNISDGDYDRTMIVVTVSDSNNSTLGLKQVGADLYSSQEFTGVINDQVDNSSPHFTYLVPHRQEAYGRGVYTAENIHPKFAKEVALEKCETGSTVALTFDDGDNGSGVFPGVL